MAASTAPAVKAELLTLLRADAGLSGVQIDYADPGGEISQEQIFFGRTIQTEQPASFGNRRQAEVYDLEVFVGTALGGNDPQTVEERGWALVAELETVVRANNGAGGALGAQITGGGSVWMGAIEMNPFTEAGQRCAVALCKVHVEARK